MRLKVAAKIILFHDNKVLIVKDPSGRWEFPGGGIDGDERLDEALRREVVEEIGIVDFSIDHLVNVDEWFIKEKDLHIVCVFYRGSVRDVPAIKRSEEHINAQWALPEDIAHMDVFPDTARALEALNA